MLVLLLLLLLKSYTASDAGRHDANNCDWWTVEEVCKGCWLAIRTVFRSSRMMAFNFPCLFSIASDA